MMERENFWHTTEANPPRPLETSVSKLDPRDAADFVRGSLEIYNAVTLVNPDVIFFPERGAAPFRWAVETLEERDGRFFYKVPLMIGTETEVEGDNQHGQTKPVKRMNVRRGIQIARSEVPQIQRPMLIDEVQLGGTIKVAAQYLLLELRQAGINVPIYIVAVQDTTDGGIERKRARGYKTLISNAKPGFRAAVVNAQLFHMDNQIYLNHQLVDYPSHVNGRRPMPMLMHNTESETFIRNLVLSFINPDALRLALDSMESGSEEELDQDAALLREWVSSFVSGLSEKSWVNREDTIQWFNSFLAETGRDSSRVTALLR